MGRWNARVKGVRRDPAAVQADGRVAGRSDAAARARRVAGPARVSACAPHGNLRP